MNSTLEETFGEVISSYSRAQAIEDGVLVDVSEALTPCPFKYPVAMSRGAYEATIAAGGKWENDYNDPQDILTPSGATLKLPGGQDVEGRMHDVFWMLQSAIRGIQRERVDRICFSVQVDTHGNGRKTRVDLYSVCGPGDTEAPVITIMLQGED
jgi:hypothetical protein